MDFQRRMKGLQRSLEKQGLDAILIASPLDIFYLTGCDLSTGLLLVGKKAARLSVDSRYYEACKASAPCPVVLAKKDPLAKLLAMKVFDGIGKVAFDSSRLDYDSYQRYHAVIKNFVQSSGARKKILLKPVKNPIQKIRAIKTEEEIAALRNAARLGSEGYDYLCSLIKPGVTEVELAIELEIFWKRRGSKGLAFDSIIAFGPNSSMPHYKPAEVKLKKGQPVLVDIGVNFQHYHSDMTRVPFLGKPSKEMAKVYAAVKEAQEAALELCRPGSAICDIDAAARASLRKSGYDKYFTHSLGHGIGLEVHEQPFLRPKEKAVLEAGMVITVEPGVYLPGVGGVRIEDTVAINEEGYENLTCRPKELLVL